MSSTIVPQSTERVAAPTRRMEPRLWLVLTAFAAVYVIWGSTYFAIHLAIESIPPFLMAGTRFLAAGLLLYAVMRARGEARPEPVHWRDATIIGGLLLLVGNGGVSWAQQTVPSGVAALMVGATPLWINLIEWVRPGGQRPQAAVFGGIALGFLTYTLIKLLRGHAGDVPPLLWFIALLFAVSLAL